MLKLNIDEQEAVQELMAHEGWNAFMKVLQSNVAFFERRVLDFNLAGRQSFEGLALEKARLEGARSFLASVQALKGKRLKTTEG